MLFLILFFFSFLGLLHVWMIVHCTFRVLRESVKSTKLNPQHKIGTKFYSIMKMYHFLFRLMMMCISITVKITSYQQSLPFQWNSNHDMTIWESEYWIPCHLFYRRTLWMLVWRSTVMFIDKIYYRQIWFILQPNEHKNNRMEFLKMVLLSIKQFVQGSFSSLLYHAPEIP